MFKELKGRTITMNQHIENLNEMEKKKKQMKILELKVQ